MHMIQELDVGQTYCNPLPRIYAYLHSCKFHKDPIKNEDAFMFTTFLPALKGM